MPFQELRHLRCIFAHALRRPPPRERRSWSLPVIPERNMESTHILGIETSCDETSVAILSDGEPVVSRTYSQVAHSAFGGVVPEVASREHLRKIDVLADQVLREAGMRISDMELVAVTDGPGLAGALLVGVSFALGLQRSHALPSAGIHHLEGHICAALLEHDVAFPFLALVVSGGHTALYRVDDIGAYTCIAQTVDDAVGEAFDKVGKLLGFAYPAGRAIDEEAAKAQSAEGISFPIARSADRELTFSFSGLKTAVKYFLEQTDSRFVAEHRPAICRAFEEAVVGSLVRNTVKAATSQDLDTVVCTGGVAANGMLRASLSQAFGGTVVFPSLRYCTDNAAMIARAAHERKKRDLLRPPRMSPSKPL
ncbi:MAG: tRNA (adenosine(37)-N6)-threonylcarbamoyltransferase complex transferase subunit TsaD [Chitinivibrionales bacterium]|nr:tRNA (adenosine(37)-N6)-threonylcarbamoyltransferase complex transferase subunit TsaD [Chitinivibrionales bacterium]